MTLTADVIAISLGIEKATVPENFPVWLADRLREFVDSAPEFEAAVDRLATWLARLDDEG